MDVTHLPLDSINPTALPRDRQSIDPDALDTLTRSIAQEGLRQPIEVFPLVGPYPWGLISGHRRFLCFQRLNTDHPGEYATIPAFIRQPADIPACLAQMVSENEVRAAITPWEKGVLVLETVHRQWFDTPANAVDALYPALSRQARSRLRGFALVVWHLNGVLTDPQRLSATRMDRLAMALRAGMTDLIEETLSTLRGASHERQWRALQPAITEAVLHPPDEDTPQPTRNPSPRPRRLLRLKNGVVLRREWTPQGWILHINAKHAAHPGIVDDILDLVERWFQG